MWAVSSLFPLSFSLTGSAPFVPFLGWSLPRRIRNLPSNLVSVDERYSDGSADEWG